MINKFFKVVPVCDKQRRDIKEEHLLEGGLYRTCDVYKGGGGYDKFPEVCKKRLGCSYKDQFVVQLYGCPLKCPYCYVTQDGIFGDYRLISVDSLITAFEQSNQGIFHLMGGAPALYIKDWVSIIERMSKKKVFHSDLLLIETGYDIDILQGINKPNTLYAVSIKGFGEDYQKNTGVRFNSDLFWKNLNRIVDCGLNFYFTYTNMSDESIGEFKEECKKRVKAYREDIFDDEFKIDLVMYEALKSS